LKLRKKEMFVCPEFLTLNYTYHFPHLQGEDLKIATFFLDTNLSEIFADVDSSRFKMLTTVKLF